MKNIWRLIGFSVMLIFLIVVGAVAETNGSGDFEYIVQDDGTLIITGYTGNDVHIDIPQALDGNKVTAIADNAFAMDEFNKESGNIVSLPDSIVSIGNKAFYQRNVTYINIPNSVEVIGAGAFAGCPTCQFVIDTAQPYYAIIDNCLYNKKEKMLVAGALNGDWVKSLSIPEGIKRVEDYACYKLNLYNDLSKYDNFTLELPESLVEIGEYAFAGCRIQGSADMFSNINKIDAYSFQRADIYLGKDEDELVFSQELESLGEGVFNGLDGDIVLVFTECNKLTTIPDHAFSNTKWIRVKLPDSITVLGNYAFSSFEGLTMLSNGNMYRVGPPMARNIVEMGEGCYEDGESYHLSECTIPGSLKVVPKHAFSGLETGASEFVLTLEEGVVRIEEKGLAFSSTIARKDGEMKVYLPQSLEYISDDAMPTEFALQFFVVPGSYAENWCKKNNCNYTYLSGEQEQDTSWLND